MRLERIIMSKNFVHTKDTKLKFGKYKGRTVREVMDFNPEYLVWAHKTISWFKLDKATFDFAVDKSVEFQFHRTMRRVLADPSMSPYWFDDDNGSWLS